MHMPDYIDEPINVNAHDICMLMNELTQQSEVFYGRFSAINRLTKYDKLCCAIQCVFVQFQQVSNGKYI